MDLFRLKDFSFTYEGRNVPALWNVNFSVAVGEFVAICGRSGGGKSTLLKMLKTELRPEGQAAGGVYFAGRLLEHVPLAEQKARIAFVMQRPEEQFGKAKGETVEDVLLAGLRELEIQEETARLRVAEMASFFGLQGWFGKAVGHLSGGQRQLLSLAAAMALQPEVLLLDEPTSQLDPIAASEFLETVAKLNREVGVAVLLCEHRLEEVLPLADRVLVVDSGTVPVYAPPGEAARELSALNHPMLFAMPTPVRIYEGLYRPQIVDTSENSGTSQRMQASKEPETAAPLTVREGREFLSQYMEAQDALTAAGNSSAAGVSAADASTAAGNSTAADASAVEGASSPAGASSSESEPTQSSKSKPSQSSESHKNGNPHVFRKLTRAFQRRKTEAGLISVKEVWFRYTREGQDVVRNLNLDIPRQKLFCLMGGNGTGKTTTLRLLAGERKPYRGRIRSEEGELFSKCLPQDPRELFALGTVREQMEQAWNGRFSPKNGEKTKEEALQWAAEQMEIQDFLDFSPENLSGGEQQRTALALVFLSQAKLLLLDEPTKGMDSHYKRKFGRLLRDEVDSGKTVVMVSHDVEFCAEHGDRCAMFFDGGIVSEGEPQEFFAGNSFYTTAANRMSRHLFPDAVTVEDVIRCAQARLGAWEE